MHIHSERIFYTVKFNMPLQRGCDVISLCMHLSVCVCARVCRCLFVLLLYMLGGWVLWSWSTLQNQLLPVLHYYYLQSTSMVYQLKQWMLYMIFYWWKEWCLKHSLCRNSTEAFLPLHNRVYKSGKPYPRFLKNGSLDLNSKQSCFTAVNSKGT